MADEEFQTVTFPMVGGIETSVAEILVQPPKLAVADNVYSPKTGSLRKRRGLSTPSELTVDGGTLTGSNQVALARYKNALLMFESPQATPNAVEYSEQLNRWQEVGKYAPGKMTSVDLTTSANDQGLWTVDCASNNYLLVAQVETRHPTPGTTSTNLLITLQDVYGTFICHRRTIKTWTTDVSQFTRIRVIAFSASFLVFYNDVDTNSLMVWTIDTTSATTITTALGAFGGTPSAPVVVAADLHNPGLALRQFDACFSSATNGVFLVYRTTTANQLKFGFVSALGVLSGTTTKLTVGGGINLAVAAATNGSTHAVCYTSGDPYAFLMSWNGTVWSTLQTSGPLDTTANMQSLACRFDSVTTLRLWYTSDYNDGPVVPAAMGAGAVQDARRFRILQSTYTTAGVVTTRTLELTRAELFSRPFVGADNQLYYWAIVGSRPAASAVQPSLFLIESATGLPVQRALEGVAIRSLLVSVAIGLNGGYALPATYIARLHNGFAVFASGSENIGCRLLTWWPTHAHSHKVREAGDCAYLAGGLLQQYDGVSWVESGFLRYVESDLINLTPAAGGSMAAGIYYYRVVAEWTNARGEREQSADTGPTPSVTIAGPNASVTLTIPSLVMTRRRHATKERSREHVVFAIYRTLVNPASNLAPYHRVGQVPNDPLSEQVTFLDILGDTSIQDEEEIYLGSGEVGHVAPPSAHIMCQGAERVVLAGLPGEPHTLWPSLLRANGEPLSFSDELAVELPSYGGDITAVAALGDGYVIWKERAIYRLRGSGPSNTLTEGGFLDAELMHDNIGCEGQGSVVETPLGVFFQAELGIYLLTPGYQLEFVGEPLVGLDAARKVTFAGGILFAVHLPLEQQVRFVGGSALMYVYDYSNRVWTIYTNGGGGGVEWNGVHAWIGGTAGGGNRLVVYESDLPFEGFDLRVVLAWFKLPPSLMEAWRVRRIMITGEVTDTANLRVKLYKNLSPTVRQTIEIDALTDGYFQVRRRINGATRVLSSLQIELDDNATADDGILTLNEITLELQRRTPGPTARID